MAKHPKPTQSRKNYERNEVELKPYSLADKLSRFHISSLEHTFENFKTLENTKGAAVLLKAISSGKSNKQFILLYGKTGSGKTHLIEATIIAWAKQGIFARYYTFSEIARSLKNALRNGGEHYDKLFNRYCETERLIVDDIGMGTTESRFEISDLEDIIDQRYRKRYYPDLNLVTIIATNKDVKELPDRVVSRFCEQEFGAVLYMGDKDYRRRPIK